MNRILSSLDRFIAYVRDRIKNDDLPARHKSDVKDQPTQQPIDLAQQLTKIDLNTWLPQISPSGPIHETILASRRQAILFRQSCLQTTILRTSVSSAGCRSLLPAFSGRAES